MKNRPLGVHGGRASANYNIESERSKVHASNCSAWTCVTGGLRLKLTHSAEQRNIGSIHYRAAAIVILCAVCHLPWYPANLS